MDRKLERNQYDKMVAGVAAGLADYLLVDVTLIRIAFILMTVFGLSGLLIYVVLWVVIPERSLYESFKHMDPFYTGAVPPVPPNPPIKPVPPIAVKKSNSGRFVAGFLLIAIGSYFLLDEFDIIPHWFSIWKLWPIILIASGIGLLLNSKKKKPLFTDPVSQPDWKADQSSTNTDQPLA